MTTPCKWRLLPLILILTLVADTGHEASAADGFFDQERFRVSEALSPDFRDMDAKKAVPFRDEFLTDGRKPTEAANLEADEDRRGWYGLRLGYFHLFFSRTVSGYGMGQDAVRSEDKRNSLLTAVQSLPSVLRSDPAGAIESVGRIFAPQVNLGIEF